MKNIQFTSQEAALKILAAMALLAFFALVGISIGLFMPPGYEAPWILAAISVGSVLLVWSIFRLSAPVSYDRNWRIAEMVLVPFCSLMLTLAAAVCVAWVIQHSVQELQNVVVEILH